MKKVVLLFILGLMLTSCEQEKIAFIDSREVFNAYDEKIDLEKRFKQKEDKFTKRRDSISSAFQLEAKEVELKIKSMTQKAIQEKYDELSLKQQRLSQQLQYEQQAIQQDYNNKIDSLFIKVKDFVEDYGQKNGYSYILGTNEATVTVLYGKEEYDISNIITEALNSNYKNQ